jgi:hypothetical protein
MKAATLHEIKNEIAHLHPAQITELCLRLARFKKENKELLSYLLFEAHNEEEYRNNVKAMMDEEFNSINSKNLYLAKKSLRKILRMANKFARYSGNTETLVDLLLHFCTLLNESGIAYQKSKVLFNLYEAQLKKAKTNIDILHEDLQYDYLKLLERLS